MKRTAIVLVGIAGAVTMTSSANASSSACRSIADPMKRLACYDNANATAPSGKTVVASPLLASAAPNPIPLKARPLSPVNSGPRFWLEAEGGIYGFSKNSPVVAATAPPASTGPTFIPTHPASSG